MSKYYQSTGKFSPTSFALIALVCLTALPVLGLVYAYAIWYIPIIYLNFLLAAGFGYAISLAVNRGVIALGKVRNGALAATFALVGSVAALYFHWAIWLDLVINSGESYGNDSIGITVSNISILESLGLALNPNIMIELIGAINETGTWGFKGKAIDGTFLTIIWVIEALIVTIVPMIMVYDRSKKPFCEASNSWTKEKELPALEHISNEEAFKTALEQGDFAFLTIIKKAGDIKKEHHSIFTLYYSDAKAYYLSVENKTPEVNSKGEVTFKSSDFIKYLTLDPAAGEMLLNFEKNAVAAMA